MTKRRWLGVAGVVAFALLVGRFFAGLYVDYRWYAALGAGPVAVWRARLVDLIAIRSVLAVAAGAFVFANLYGVSSSVESLVLPRRLGDLEIGERVPGRRLLWAAALVALTAGVLLSLVVDDWTSFDLVQFARPFGVPDPYTDADLGFFVFWLPFEDALYLWAIALLLAASAMVLALYVLTGGLRWESARVRATRHVRRHLTALAAGLLLVLAWGHRLDAFSLLWSGSGTDDAFTYLDDQIVMRARFSLAALTAIAALVVFNAGWQGKSRLTFWTVSGVIAATFILRGVVPAIAARVVSSDEFARHNAPYLRNRAAVTQTAYGVNVIKQAPEGYGLADAAATDGVVSIWDPLPLARAVERERRGEIVAAELGWQPIADRLATVAVMRPAPPPDAEPRTWTPVLAAASIADAAGEPALLDPAGAPSAAFEPRDRRLLSLPQASGYAIVNDTTGRLVADPIGTFWSRLAHAWDERDLRLLFDQDIDRMESPVIALHRDVAERIAAVAPFFIRGRAIAPIVVRDTLYWASHLYAASQTFPLSQRYTVAGETWGYFRHAAVAIVNAETGAVTLVADPFPDHVAEAWIRRFPSLFSPPSGLPPALVAALPPATDGVMLQASALSQYGSRYGLTASPVHFPGGESGDSTIGVGARAFSLLPVAGASGERALAWTLPLLDQSDRVAGVLIALGGSRPTTLWLTNPRVGDRWSDVADRLRGAAAGMPSLTEGHDVARGRVTTVPIGGRLAYLQSMYVVREDGRSVLAGAAALRDDTVRVGRTAREAFGASPATATAGARAPLTAEVPAPARIRALYETMRGAMRRGDWTGFGTAFDSLGAVIGRTPR